MFTGSRSLPNGRTVSLLNGRNVRKSMSDIQSVTTESDLYGCSEKQAE